MTFYHFSIVYQYNQIIMIWLGLIQLFRLGFRDQNHSVLHPQPPTTISCPLNYDQGSLPDIMLKRSLQRQT